MGGKRSVDIFRRDKFLNRKIPFCSEFLFICCKDSISQFAPCLCPIRFVLLSPSSVALALPNASCHLHPLPTNRIACLVSWYALTLSCLEIDFVPLKLCIKIFLFSMFERISIHPSSHPSELTTKTTEEMKKKS